ncbi:MAG: glycosyltransferase family 10 [Magnetococcus sp. MYC-9]
MVDVNFFGVTESPAMRMACLRVPSNAPRLYKDVSFHINHPEAEWQLVGTWELEQFVAQGGDRRAGQRCIYLQQEPPVMRWPAAGLLERFAAILTPMAMDREGPPQFIGAPALRWTYGLHVEMREGVGHWFSEQGGLSWETLQGMTMPRKERLCSMIVSQKAFLPGHQARLDFFRRLTQHFQGRIDFFGFGFHPIPDKREAIDPYLFSIAVENSAYAHYWTEKIADVYLGYGMPIYFGAPNIHHYFPPDSLQRIDLQQQDATIARIETLLDHPEQYAGPAVAEARRRLLEEHNLFDWVVRVIRQLDDGKPSTGRGGDES